MNEIIYPKQMIVIYIRKGYNAGCKAPKINKKYKVKEIHLQYKFLDGTDNSTWYKVKGIKTNVHHSSLFKIVEIDDETLKILIENNITKFQALTTLNKIFEI